MKKLKINASKIIFVGLRVIMGLLLAVCILGIILDKDESARSRYIFNAVQALIFLIISLAPHMLKKFKVEIPDAMLVAFILFGFAHFFLGEVMNFYATVKWWDSMLHTLSGGMIALLSFSLIYLLNNNKNGELKLNTFFMMLFAFSFTILIGAVWEVIEWFADEFAGTNMQRWANSITHEPFVGREALKDTMKDIILDMIGATVVCTTCGILIHKKGGITDNLIVLRRIKAEEEEGVEKTSSIETAGSQMSDPAEENNDKTEETAIQSNNKNE